MANTSSLSRRVSPPVLSIILAVLLFLAVNLFAGVKLEGPRLDLTDQALFTLSDSTKAVLASIDEPVTIRVYKTSRFIDAVPGLATHAAQVSELLSTFQQVSGGKVHVETIDVAPFSPEEDDALAHGLHGFNLNAQGERGYFGLVGTNTVDTVETIDFLDPARAAFLQYDLTRIVYRLVHPDEPQVAVIDGLSMFGAAAEGRQPWAILDVLAQDYSIKQVAQNATSIPPNTSVVLIAHPTQMSPAMQYAVDQYVLGGGTALVFVDPDAEASPPNMQNPNMPQNPASDLPALLGAWGVKVDPTKVVGDRKMALQTVGVSGNTRVVANYVPWLRVDGDAFSKDDPVTARLEVMRMSSAGAIETLPGATTKVTPLIQTTTDSMLIDQQLILGHPNPNQLLDDFKPSGQRQVLAARITGPAKTAFPDGPPKDADKPADPDAPPPPAPTGPQLKTGNVNVILVSDSDMLADTHIVDEQGHPISSNGDFVLNAVDDLAGGKALIGLRGGGLANRPFTTIEAMQQKAENTYRSTEQQLTQQLQDAQQKLAQLQDPNAPDGSDPASASRTQDTINDYNAKIVSLRRQLRDVQLALRSEIDQLETRIRVIDIALMPVLVILAALALALWRRYRLARYMAGLKTATKAG
ncbi:MAG TPA: Gldg family protein [Devosia sp.]|nr:Gldg family protein [Devosia sp.]